MRVGWIVVNDRKPLLSLYRGNRVETTLNISDYGFDPSKYQFDEVEVDAQTAGDMATDDGTLVT